MKLPGGTRYQHIVMDIGGTWFRSALRTADGTLTGFARQPAVSYVNYPKLTQLQLQARLVDYALNEVQRLASSNDRTALRASISMGAAVNGHTGVILNAGPLWGPQSEPFDLKATLIQARSDVVWSIVNDVVSLAAHFVRVPKYRSLQKIAAIVIGTGIACKTIDVASKEVPLHPARGIQGEIGHIPISFRVGDVDLMLRCDCGGAAHLNAYSSGRGIPQVMEQVADVLQKPRWKSAEMSRHPGGWATILKQELADKDAAAAILLDSVVEPVARSIVSLLSVDPQVGAVVIAGGVPSSLGEFYQAALIRKLEFLELYMISNGNPEFFRELVDFASVESNAGLHGAAIAAETGERSSSTLLLDRRRSLIETKEISYEMTLMDSAAGAAVIESLAKMSSGKRPLLLADESVAQTYGEALVSDLKQAGYSPDMRTVTGGEPAKNWASLEEVLIMLESAKVSRNKNPIIAMGGGAILDTVGLAAGLYRRGVPYIRVPTSLVGLVDAGVGIKVAINMFGQKNRLGLFCPPQSVVLDVFFLRTLPRRFLLSGVAEMIKIAAVQDLRLMELIERNSRHLTDASFYRTSHGIDLVARAADASISSLEGNLYEVDLVRSADFGHSVSQAIERKCSVSTTHGEAVAVDMALAIEIGRARGVTDSDLADRFMWLLEACRLPLYVEDVTSEDLFGALEDTARHRGGKQWFPLIREIGKRPDFVNDVAYVEVVTAWSRLKNRKG